MNFFPPIFDNGFWINFRITRFTHCFFFFSRRMRQRTRQTSVYNNSCSLTIRWRAAEVYFSSQICTGILPQTKSFDRGWFTKEAGCFEIKLFTEEIRCFHGMPRRNSFRLYRLHLRASCPCCQRIKERRTRNAKRGDVGVFWSVSSHFSS